MKIILIAALIFAAIFSFFPDIDLMTSGMFYTEGQGFTLRTHSVLVFIYDYVRILTGALIACLFLYLLLRMLVRYIPALSASKYIPSYRVILFLILSLALGPGLLVHNGIKDHWGRARPVNIQEFGGDKRFTPALVISDQGGKSFVSGHASMGFYFVAFALLATGALRRNIYITAIFLGCFLGLARIMQGGHFLSDVAFTGIVILLTIHILNYFMLRPDGKES